MTQDGLGVRFKQSLNWILAVGITPGGNLWHCLNEYLGVTVLTLGDWGKRVSLIKMGSQKEEFKGEGR